MKANSFPLFLVLLTLYAFASNTAFPQQRIGDFPEFEFDVWASPPSSKVYELTNKRIVQAILYSIRERPIRSDEIATNINEPDSLVIEELMALEKFNLVRKEKERWICNIPLYIEKEIREAEKIGLRYAEKEAAILRGEIQSLKTIF